MTQKIVINTCYGGFSLSDQAIHEVARRKGLELTTYDIGENIPVYMYEDQYGCGFEDFDLERNDPALVAAVEELGTQANGVCAILKVVEIPDDVDWYIEEYDGIEWVAEKHRTWG